MAEDLDLEAVAEMLGVDHTAAYFLVRTCELRAIKIPMGWRVERLDVLRYNASH